MFQANCYNVMIVSPSDISEERETLTKQMLQSTMKDAFV